jgi:methionyl-tRNA formyltransferase
MVKAVFWGSSDSVFSNRHYEALEETGCRIVGVVDVPVGRRSSTNAARQQQDGFTQRAADRAIPVLQPESPNAPDFVERVRALEPDLFIAAGYMLLLKAQILSLPRVIAANFHASLLPAYRGKHPVFWALRSGEKQCGLTVHEMGTGLDTGDILFQVRVPVREGDSVSVLYDRIMAESTPLVARLLMCVEAGNVPRTPQPAEGASYFGATTEDDFRLDWRKDAGTLLRWILATPGQCFVEIDGERRFVVDAARCDELADGAPGAILRLTAESCAVRCGDGALRMHFRAQEKQR